MAREKDLHDAFYETLKDVYFAEKQSVKACKKGAKAASAPELKAALLEHAETSQHQVSRLEQVFETIDKTPRAKTCEAKSGIVSEMEEDLGDCQFGRFRKTVAKRVGQDLTVPPVQRVWETGIRRRDLRRSSLLISRRL